MTDQTPAVESSARLSERGSMAHLLWFFALVYLVEGLGQIGGLISQPLNYYLKQVQGWTPLQITAYLTLFNLPWIIKPLYGLLSDFIPLFGYRRKSYLLIANAAATCGCEPAHHARQVGFCSDADRLCDGDFQYVVWSGLGGEWPAP